MAVQGKRRPDRDKRQRVSARSAGRKDTGMSERNGSDVAWDRRKFLAAAATGIVGSTAAASASAESLADVPVREPGADLGALSARSTYVKIGRIPEAGPGRRNVDPADAI